MHFYCGSRKNIEDYLKKIIFCYFESFLSLSGFCGLCYWTSTNQTSSNRTANKWKAVFTGHQLNYRSFFLLVFYQPTYLNKSEEWLNTTLNTEGGAQGRGIWVGHIRLFVTFDHPWFDVQLFVLGFLFNICVTFGFRLFYVQLLYLRLLSVLIFLFFYFSPFYIQLVFCFPLSNLDTYALYITFFSFHHLQPIKCAVIWVWHVPICYK
jgi:hypothetical protein